MTALALDDVRFRYPGAGTDALAGVSLSIRAGEFVWLYGRVGAGTTTALLVAAGLAPRHTGGTLLGRVRALDVDPAGGERGALAGRVVCMTATPALQLSGVAATVWEEVAFAPANLGWPRERIGRAVDEALERLGVALLAERDPTTLSGGEIQRVVLAGMLALAPAVWLLDEPTWALDATGRRQLARLLHDEAKRGAAVVVASEDPDLWLGVADRLVLLEAGRVVAEGEPAVLLADETVWRAGPGSTAVAELARAAGWLCESPLLGAPYPLTVDEGVARWRR